MTSVKNFLDRVRKDHVGVVGVDEYIDALAFAEMLNARPDQPQARRELRSGLASLLATNRDQWDEIAALAGEFFPEGAADRIDVAAIPLDHQGAAAVQPQSRGARLGAWLLDLPRWVFIAIFAALVAAAVAIILLLFYSNQTERQPSRVPGPPASVEQPAWSRDVLNGRNQEIEIAVATGTSSPLPGTLVAFSAFLIIAGVSWLLLPGRIRARRDAEAKSKAEEAFASRKELSKAAEEAGASRRLVYHVESVPPLREDAAADAATILSRTYGDVRSADLDVDRTVDATIEAGGRFSPVRAKRVTSRTITLLVDVEGQGHPWLHDVEWLLRRWRALGVHFERYTFASDPFDLITPREGLPLSLEKLSRRAEGEPLLVISRKLKTTEYQQSRARWLAFRNCWPVRAWLDPSPLALDEFPSAYRAEIGKLTRWGFQRFPFTEVGVVALATFLASSGVGVKAPPAKRLPSLLKPEIAQAVERWALFSALVPDPTWDQLQAIRETLPELREALPENRYLQRLLDWARINNKDGGAESGDGLTLEIDPARIEELIVKYRRIEAELPIESKFETRCRELILNQLGATAPSDALMREFWGLKRAQHQLAISPAAGLAALRPLLDGPWRDEALQILETEIVRHQAMPTLPSSVRDAALLELPRHRGLVKWLSLMLPGWLPILSATLVAWAIWIAAILMLYQSEAGITITGSLPLVEPDGEWSANAQQTADFDVVARGTASAVVPVPAAAAETDELVQDRILTVGDASCSFERDFTRLLNEVRLEPPEAAQGPQGRVQQMRESLQDLRTFDVEDVATNAEQPAEDRPFNLLLLTEEAGRFFWNAMPIDDDTLLQNLLVSTLIDPMPNLVMTVSSDVRCDRALQLVDFLRRTNSCFADSCRMSIQ